MDLLHIEPNDDKGKGRVFRAGLLGYMEAPALWPQSSDNERPVWMAYAATETQAKPFTANLQTGRKAKVPRANPGSLSEGTTFELLRSAGYVFAPQRFEGLSAVTVYLPEFFVLDPGMVDPEGIKFIAAPSKEWCAQRLSRIPDPKACVAHVLKVRSKPKGKGKTQSEGPTPEQLLDLLPLASLFAAYLDRRTRAPLIPDPRFHLQLLAACADAELGSFPEYRESHWSDRAWGTSGGFKAKGLDTAGLQTPVAFRAKHDTFQKLLAGEVSRYFQAIGA